MKRTFHSLYTAAEIIEISEVIKSQTLGLLTEHQIVFGKFTDYLVNMRPNSSPPREEPVALILTNSQYMSYTYIYTYLVFGRRWTSLGRGPSL